MDSKDKESIYYKEIRDLVNKNTFDKVLECTFKIYNNEFSVKGTNGKDYPVLKKIYDISNIIISHNFYPIYYRKKCER